MTNGSPKRWHSFATRPSTPRSGLATGCCSRPPSSSLEPKYRELLGLRTARLGPIPLPVTLATRVTLGVVHVALGRMGPSEQAARARLRRLGYRA